MASHPLKRNDVPRNSASAYDSLSHSDGENGGDEYDSQDYSDELSGGYGDGGYDEYGDLNSEAEEYYNSGASELVTTVR